MNETPPLPKTEEPPRPVPIPVVTLRPGTVDCAQPHVELWAEKGSRLVVRAAPADLAEPDAGAFVVQWEEEEAAQRWRKEAEAELDFYLVSKKEMWPWAYLCYHCGTGADWYAHDGGGVYFVQRDPAEEARRAGVAAALR